MMLDQLPTLLIAAAEASEAVKDAAPPEKSAMHGTLMWFANAGVGVLVLSIILCLWRVIKGPHLADRVLAGDTMAMVVAGVVVLIAVLYESAVFYDAALVVAILGFVSTVAFSQYIGAKQKHADDPADNTAQAEERAA